MVAPDRETPGMSARAWANPNNVASLPLRLAIVRVRRPSASQAPSTTPNPASMAAVSQRLRATVSIWSANVNPSTAIGMVPRMTYQPIFASWSRRRSGRTSERAQVLMMRAMSCRKYTMTAASVPICVTAVNAAPGSPQPKICDRTRMCALEEIGRNSVRPWTTPRTMASNQLTRRGPPRREAQAWRERWRCAPRVDRRRPQP